VPLPTPRFFSFAPWTDVGERVDGRAVELRLAERLGAAVYVGVDELFDDVGEPGCVHRGGYAAFGETSANASRTGSEDCREPAPANGVEGR
jgi:hypothetical protein